MNAAIKKLNTNAIFLITQIICKKRCKSMDNKVITQRTIGFILSQNKANEMIYSMLSIEGQRITERLNQNKSRMIYATKKIDF